MHSSLPTLLAASVTVSFALAGEPPPGLQGKRDPVTGLVHHPGCTLDPTDWADGDSLQVVFPGGQKHVIRLYGVDCFETDAGDDSQQRRLREQRAHFGIQQVGDAVALGLAARDKTRELLRQPFTVCTDWAKAPGRSGMPRFYAFVLTADRKDLTAELAASGLGWARGIYRQSPDGASRNAYEARIVGLEQAAALKRRGAWRLSDPDNLPAQREAEEREQEKSEQVIQTAAAAKLQHLRDHPINPNTASPEALDELPHIGPALANRIIEERGKAPFKNPEDLMRVDGIAEKAVDALRPFLTFD